MLRIKHIEIHASEVSDFLNDNLIGSNFIICKPTSVSNLENGAFTLLNNVTEKHIEKINKFKNVLVITDFEIKGLNPDNAYIKIKESEIEFIRVVNEFFVIDEGANVAKTAVVHPEVKLGRNITVGENCYIGPEVSIGNNTVILNNVVITGMVEIGQNCMLKNNCTVGSEAYNFVFDEKGNPQHYPNLGKIIIGDNVWIGANSTIECGDYDNTVIGDYVKIDDLVQIGAGCNIAKRVFITAGVIMSSKVSVGENTWISPNATICNNICIGKNSKIGLGAVVLKNIEDNAVYVGNPAKFLKNN